jgi:hypothetical protein
MFSDMQTVALLTVPEMDQALGDNTAYRARRMKLPRP